MPDAPPRVVVRLRQAAVCLLLVVVAFQQSPGLIGNDTKLDLTAGPARFLARSLDLWNPSAAFGQLQNQAYGYLFPMGPFHLLGVSAGVPEWVVQRSWTALLLVVALLGVLRLAARLDLGTESTRLLGALAYALAPRVLTGIGGNSAELLPYALLPWVMVPLVGARAEAAPRTAAARSGVAVLCMGAANATSVLALLPLPALWLVPGLRRAAGRRLAAWWALAVSLAVSWWVGPLLLQGRYSPDFLDYIETAATTTGTTSLPEVLRGTSHWLGYLATEGGPWWPAGWSLVTNPGVIVNTAVLAALCVVGLLRRGMPAQGRLVGAAALGLLAMSAAYAGPLGGPLAEPLRSLLDGPLAPFRNVHKFDGLVRLPLALGLCHLLALAPRGQSRRLLAAVVAVGVVGSSAPALAGQLVPPGGYVALPAWWTATGQWLDERDAGSRALVVPATGFGEYLWGRPLDQPLQALTGAPWAVRDAVPIGSPGSTRLLDAVEARLGAGRGSAGLAEVLARSGVGHLVVSNDLDPGRTGAPRPVLVAQALADSPGLRRVAAFGPTVGGDDLAERSLVSDDGLAVRVRAVEVWEVVGATEPVSSLPRAGTWVVSGGPESLLQLGERGLLAGRATVLAGDGEAGPASQPAVTDALRRREVDFGRVRDGASATLAADAPLVRPQPVPDVLPVPGDERLATARLVGAAAVTASSSAADPGAALARRPDRQPVSAFDGDARTAWVTGSLPGAAGQWVEVELDEPVDPAGTAVRLLLDDPAVRGVPTAVTVVTDGGARTTALRAVDRPQDVEVPPGPTRRLRVVLEQVRGDGFAVLAGLREVAVPGVEVATTIVLPDDQPSTDDAVVLLDRAVGGRDGCVETAARTLCSPALPRPGEDVVRLDRTFALGAPRTAVISGSARPVPGPDLDALLDRDLMVRVRASSRAVDDPRRRPATVVDGDVRTGWTAAATDRAPSLVLTWPQPREVDRLVLRTDHRLAAARATEVEVTTSVGTTRVEVPGSGVVRFPAATTDRLEVRATATEERVSFGRDGSARRLPWGVSELAVPALADLVPPPADPDAAVELPCGTAPPVVVGGVPHRTAVLGTRQDLLRLRPLPLSLCDAAAGLALDAGEHRVVGGEAGGVRVESLTVGTPPPAAPPPPRTTRVLRWDAEDREVVVGPGEAAYLVVHENANAGWRATLDGVALEPARLDGWQQAWVLPAGAGGAVRLEFLPGRTFDRALLLGAALALLLVGLALAPARSRRPALVPRPAPAAPGWSPPPAARLAVAVPAGWLLGGLAGAGCVLLAGAAVLVARQRLGADRASVAAAATAGAALTLAGLLTAAAPWSSSPDPAGLGGPAQLLALVVVGVAAAVVTVLPSSSAASAPAPAPPPGAG